MGNLASRLAKLETSSKPLHNGVLRIIYTEALTADQEREIADAKEGGKLVILREVISPKAH